MPRNEQSQLQIHAPISNTLFSKRQDTPCRAAQPIKVRGSRTVTIPAAAAAFHFHLRPTDQLSIDDSPVFSPTSTLLEVPCICMARRGHTLFRLRRLRRWGGSSRGVSIGQGIEARRPRRHTLRRRDIPPPRLHVGARELTSYMKQTPSR